MRIAILNYEDAVPTCVTGPADIWRGMIRMYPLLTGNKLKQEIRVEFVSLNHSTQHFYTTPAGSTQPVKLSTEEVFDLIIIPAMYFERIEAVITGEQTLIRWLQQQYTQGAELASICVGAFLLAATGLLEGKKITTNWLFAKPFRERFPNIELQDDKVIVDQGRLYSCGGAFSFTSFMIYLIEKFCGHEEATAASKILMINVHDLPQRTFSIFKFQYEHGDEVITRAQKYIEDKFQDTLTLEDIASHCSMSVRNLCRRFESATANTPFEYLQRVRIEAAKEMLERKQEGIEQVSLHCGYDDVNYFRKVFKRHVAMTPRAYQEKYGRKRAHIA
ncbi:transcriptional regulator GlxA family with amidase domain [Chitinophaga dinghuensis]|uniref:Transcriptional regulator GlxA family with amidase domain n=1 Tax=Chitinophaga dinghuensis TaxID=1539050 RepID=A0A327WFB7_9BACT|nr:AraC family transcriptional regulator [Chitinophaga dinghuensis]RAJ88076.1 transcriptional regulator GlxA family with amidase domain [Chitinophaga dinghuensis]